MTDHRVRKRSDAEHANRAAPGQTALRWAAIAAWSTSLVWFVLTSGMPSDPPLVLMWTVAAAIAFSIGRRAVWVIVVDFLPLAAVLLAWVYLRGAATSFGMPALWTPQIAFDRHLFFGVEPTVWLQSHLRYATPRWWDVPVTICYLSFFVVPLSMAVFLWLRSRVDYYRWAGRYFALSFLAFACFAVFPSAPPWAAASCSAVDVATRPSNPPCMYEPPWVNHGGMLGAFPLSHSGVTPYVQKNATAGLSEMHLTVAQRLIDHGDRTVDLMAAVPSLHAGASMLIAIFLWPRVGRTSRVLLAAYPVFMGFTLVYSGDHYVFDILTGWVAAVLVCIVAARLERRRRDAETLRKPLTVVQRDADDPAARGIATQTYLPEDPDGSKRAASRALNDIWQDDGVAE